MNFLKKIEENASNVRLIIEDDGSENIKFKCKIEGGIETELKGDFFIPYYLQYFIDDYNNKEDNFILTPNYLLFSGSGEKCHLNSLKIELLPKGGGFFDEGVGDADCCGIV